MISTITTAPCLALLPLLLLSNPASNPEPVTPVAYAHSASVGAHVSPTVLPLSAEISCPGFEDVTRAWTITVVFAGDQYVTCSEKSSTLQSMMRDHIIDAYECSDASECPAQEGNPTPPCNPKAANFTLSNSSCTVTDLQEMNLDQLLEAVGAADDFERGAPQANGDYKVTTIQFEMDATGTVNCNCPEEF